MNLVFSCIWGMKKASTLRAPDMFIRLMFTSDLYPLLIRAFICAAGWQNIAVASGWPELIRRAYSLLETKSITSLCSHRAAQTFIMSISWCDCEGTMSISWCDCEGKISRRHPLSPANATAVFAALIVSMINKSTALLFLSGNWAGVRFGRAAARPSVANFVKIRRTKAMLVNFRDSCERRRGNADIRMVLVAHRKRRGVRVFA